MNTELLNKLTNLTFYGFYEPFKKLVIVHFFNEDKDKADIIAYLKKNMVWDVREIVSEKSILLNDREIITLMHKTISLEIPKSGFDDFVRVGLIKIAQEVYGEDADLEKINPMFKVLKNNKY